MDNTNNFVLQEVINDLTSSEKSLATPLMRILYFAKRIKHDELIQLVSSELNGYTAQLDIPNYRKTLGTIEVDVQAGYNTHKVNLPPIMIDEKYRDIISYVRIKEGIGTVEKWVIDSKKDNKNNSLSRSFPIQMVSILQPGIAKLYKSDTPVHAVGFRVYTTTDIAIQIIISVRAMLLGLLMEIGEKFGYNIDITSFRQNQLQNNQKITNYMHTEIHNTGDGNINNTGDDSSIIATITINKGDIQKLNNELQKLGIDEADIEELTDIVKNDMPDPDRKILGSKTNSKILDIMGKALSGVGKIATGASGNIIATMIKQYYGIDN